MSSLDLAVIGNCSYSALVDQQGRIRYALHGVGAAARDDEHPVKVVLPVKDPLEDDPVVCSFDDHGQVLGGQ